MSRIHLSYTKNQESFNLNEKTTEANPEMMQMLELSAKDFEAAVIKMLQ